MKKCFVLQIITIILFAFFCSDVSYAALLFTEADADDVNHGNDASVNDLWHTAETFIMWFRPAQVNNTFKVLKKKKRNQLTISPTNGTILNVAYNYSGTAGDAASNSILSVGVWSFIAVTFGGVGTAPTIYHGTLSSEPTDETSSSRVAVGTPETEAAEDLRFGGNIAGDSAGGDIAMVMLYDSVLTLGQLKSIWYQSRIIKSGCKLFSIYGYNGVGTQADWSGNGNNGTVTGATVSDHVPLGPPFGAMIPLFLIPFFFIKRRKSVK